MESRVEYCTKLLFDFEVRKRRGRISVNGLGAESPGPLLEPVHRFRLMSVDKEIGPVLVHFSTIIIVITFSRLKATAAASSLSFLLLLLLFLSFYFFSPFAPLVSISRDESRSDVKGCTRFHDV